MTILAIASSLSDFEALVPGLVSTDSARLAPGCAEGVIIGPEQSADIRLPIPETSPLVWIGFSINFTKEFNNNSPFFRVLSPAGNQIMSLQFDDDADGTYAGDLAINDQSGAPSRRAIALVEDQTYRFDVRLEISDTATIEVFIDGVSVGTHSGDTQPGAAGARKIWFTPTITGAGTNADWEYTLSGVVVADTDTRGVEIVSLEPVAAGNYTDFSGAVGDVSGTGITDATKITTTAAGRATFTKTALPGAYATGYDILGLGVSARVRAGLDAPGDVQLLTRSGGLDDQSSITSVSPLYEPVQGVFEQDPATNAAWTVAGLDGAEIGVRVT